MRLEHFLVRREPKRTVIWGWDARRGMIVGLMLALMPAYAGFCPVGAGSLAEATLVYAAIVATLCGIGATVGFRIAVDEGGVRVTKVLLGVPYRQRRIPLRDTQVFVHYETLDDDEPEGALVERADRSAERGDDTGRWVVGTSKNANALADAIREEIARVSAALEPTPTYRT